MILTRSYHSIRYPIWRSMTPFCDFRVLYCKLSQVTVDAMNQNKLCDQEMTPGSLHFSNNNKGSQGKGQKRLENKSEGCTIILKPCSRNWTKQPTFLKNIKEKVAEYWGKDSLARVCEPTSKPAFLFGPSILIIKRLWKCWDHILVSLV